MAARTDVLYEACRSRGGHRKSDIKIRRDVAGASIEMVQCADCGVPFGGSGRRSPYAPPEPHVP